MNNNFLSLPSFMWRNLVVVVVGVVSFMLSFDLRIHLLVVCCSSGYNTGRGAVRENDEISWCEMMLTRAKKIETSECCPDSWSEIWNRASRKYQKEILSSVFFHLSSSHRYLLLPEGFNKQQQQQQFVVQKNTLHIAQFAIVINWWWRKNIPQLIQCCSRQVHNGALLPSCL